MLCKYHPFEILGNTAVQIFLFCLLAEIKGERVPRLKAKKMKNIMAVLFFKVTLVATHWNSNPMSSFVVIEFETQSSGNIQVGD